MGCGDAAKELTGAAFRALAQLVEQQDPGLKRLPMRRAVDPKGRAEWVWEKHVDDWECGRAIDIDEIAAATREADESSSSSGDDDDDDEVAAPTREADDAKRTLEEAAEDFVSEKVARKAMAVAKGRQAAASGRG